MVSEHLPVWFLNRWPDRKVILASYSDDKAGEWGGKARDHLLEGYKSGILDITVKGGESAAASEWKIDGRRGELLAKGTGGRMTGSGAHLRIIDDPIKGEEDANSPRLRDNLSNWYDSVYTTRAEFLKFPAGNSNQGIEVMMFTRWHEDDLAGRYVFEPDSDTVRDAWCLLNLPALAEEGDQLGRKEGEALCPELVTHDFLLSMQEQSPTWFAALYQGKPVVEGSGILAGPYRTYTDEGDCLKTDRDEIIPHQHLIRFATMDTAMTDRTHSDYTVFTVWGKDRRGRLFLLGREKMRILGPEHKHYLKAWWDAYAPLTAVGVEDMNSGKQLIQEWRSSDDLKGIIIQPLYPDRDKISRAIPYGIGIREGKVFFPADAPWLSNWLNEHGKFPNAAHDDQVDAAAYAWHMANAYGVTKDAKPEAVTDDEKVWEHVLAKIDGKSTVEGTYWDILS